jgi:glutamate synthase domain-containing protein 3
MSSKCEHLTSRIESIAKICQSFDFLDAKKSIHIKKRLVFEILDVMYEASPGSAYMKLIENEQIASQWQEIALDCARKSDSRESFMLSFVSRFRRECITPHIQTVIKYRGVAVRDYARFMKELVTSKIVEKTIDRVDSEISKSRSKNSQIFNLSENELYASLNTSFLQEIISEKQTLDLRNIKIPAALFDYFAFGLSQGKIILDRAGTAVGGWLDGGHIVVNEAGVIAGIGMRRGRIDANSANDSFGMNMSGGVATAEVCKKWAAQSISGGVCFVRETEEAAGIKAEGGIVMVESGKNVGEKTVGENPLFLISEWAKYDYNVKQFITSKCYQRHIKRSSWQPEGYYDAGDLGGFDVDSVQEFREVVDGNGLAIVHESRWAKLLGPNNLFEGMKSGVALFRKAPLFDIGRGMLGGVVIIEDENVTIEEIRKRISPKKQGGLILLRVRNKDNPDITTLVDVEGVKWEKPPAEEPKTRWVFKTR